MKAIGGRRNIPTDEDVMALRTLPVQDCAENKLVTCCLFKNSLITLTEPGGETIVGGLTRKASDKVLLLGLGDTVELHVLYSRGTLAMFNWKLCTVEDEFLLGKLVGVPETIWYNELGTVVIIDNLAVRLIELGTLDHHHSTHSTFKSGYSELAVFRRNMSLLSRNNWCYQNQKGDYLIFYEGYNEAQEKACFMMINVRYQLMKRLEVDHCGQVAQFLYAMDPPRLSIVEQGQENGLRYKEGIPN
ncbi:uncharacterized protein KQ657_004665 [Scheffersomyces spartinae]|uniref:Uncharacterized protein n=1 Tax=Scheffersomyces spartinae TaxID=45513 RepID=A0A9P7VAT9_9ASCO|nr:uncharacterized protein KQ657_004665 [Scheffersomyces spartinae]KAG7194452.1 hypothetical protein KQ657_004665 [Scheffersomyces spartinae]